SSPLGRWSGPWEDHTDGTKHDTCHGERTVEARPAPHLYAALTTQDGRTSPTLHRAWRPHAPRLLRHGRHPLPPIRPGQGVPLARRAGVPHRPFPKSVLRGMVPFLLPLLTAVELVAGACSGIGFFQVLLGAGKG